MKKTNWLAGGAVVVALVLTGCAKQASVTVGDGRGSKFCADVADFQVQAVALEQASTGDLATFRREVRTTTDQLHALQAEANPANKVNGGSVKDDLGVQAATYESLDQALQAANPSDPAAVTAALASWLSKNGQAFTKATDQVDIYARQACGVTGTLAPTTTPGPVGPGVTSAPGGATTTTR